MKKIVTIALIIVSIMPRLAQAEENCAGFTDVSISDPACPAIEFLNRHQMLTGYEDNTLRLDNHVTRAEALKEAVIILIGEITDTETNLSPPFPDVFVDSWYAPYIDLALKQGLIQGYPDGLFRPENQVSRVELLKMFLTDGGFKLPVTTQDLYTDVKKEDWFAPYIQYVVERNYFSPVQDTFGVTVPATRREVVQLTYNLIVGGEPATEKTLAKVTELKKEVENLRKLSFIEPLTVREIKRTDLQHNYSYYSNLMDESTALFSNHEKVLDAFYLTDSAEPSVEISQASFYGDQIIGFYSVDENILYLSSDLANETWQDFTIVHELTHALADQYYDLSSPGLGNDDAFLAWQATMEGDAITAEKGYLWQYGLIDPALDIAPNYDEGNINLSALMELEAFFPYTAGAEFVMALREENGTAGVDQAYLDPPLSTEQILHPEKYLVKEIFDLPTIVTLPTTNLDTNWQLLEENVWGELDTQLVLLYIEPMDKALVDASGWDGDIYRVFMNTVTNEVILIQKSVWDTEKDASEYLIARRNFAHTRAPQASQWIHKKGREVIEILSTNEEAVETVRKQLQ